MSDFGKWAADSTRLTAFFPQIVDNRDAQWFQRIVGEPPDDKIDRRRQGLTEEQGIFKGLVLRIISLPDRIDFRFVDTADHDPTDTQARAGDLGDVSAAIMAIDDIAGRFFAADARPELSRLAFGMVARQEATTRKGAYEVIDDLLPSVRIDTENTTDFLYQVNRPITSQSGVPNLRINRLCKWSVVSLTRVLIPMDKPHSFLPMEGAREIYACNVDIDMNTAPDFGTLPAGALPGLWKELATLGRERIEKGDMP